MKGKKKITVLTLILAILIAECSIFIPTKVFCEENNFNIVGVIVRSSSGSSSVYPGSRRVSLRIEVMYLNNKTAVAVTGRLETVSGIEFSSGSGPSAPARSLNGSVALKINVGDHVAFNYYLDISKSLNPGNYILTLNITYRFEFNTTLLFEAHNITMEVSHYPEIKLHVVDAYLSPASYPGSSGTNLYVLIENIGEASIDSADFEVSLPSGFTVSDPRTRVGAVNRGERFTLTFSGISVPLSASISMYHARIYVDATMRTEDDVNYDESAYIDIWFKISKPPEEQPLVLSSIAVLYQGSPAPLLPSARDVTVRVTLINRLPDAVSAMTVTPDLPNGITLQSISGTYVNGMPAGGSAFIDLTVNVSSDIQPGRYVIPLSVSYVRIVSGASFMADQTVNVTVTLESHHSYVPEVSLISAYWGLQNPTPVYEGSQYIPLTLRFINNGRYDIVGGVVRAYSEFLRPIKNSEALSARLTPGAYSSVTLYFDVNANAGSIPLNVLIDYVFDEFGTHINVTRSFKVYLSVEEYPASASNLRIVSSGWQNDYNVFPRTKNAIYEVTISNRAPFSVGGILLSLRLPENMSSDGSEEANAYVEGPIRSLDTFTVSFTISVGDLQPREYNATLTADFILLSGGPGIRCVEKHNLTIEVEDDSQAVEFVDSRWYEGAVGPNTYGVHLLISMRDNYVDSMRGALLELNLPEGMLNALDNTSYVKIAPLSGGLLGLNQPMQAQDLSALINAYLSASQAGGAITFSKGDILTFVTILHILDLSVGVHNLEGELSYIDQWGTKRTVKITIPVAILGRTEYIETYMSGSLSVRSKFTNTSLTIRNVGSSPIYDVYVAISPFQGTPILIASPTVTYIGKINAYEKIEIPVTLAYNPLGFLSQTGGATLINYGPVPFMISVIYRDASGTLKRFNNTVTVVVEPFIDLLIKDVSTIGKSSMSTIRGVAINYGSATAYRVKAIFKVGNVSRSTLIGDVEPGSEMAFRIEVPAYEENGTLRLEYYNIFDEMAYREMVVNIELQPEEPTATSPPEKGMSIETWIVIGAVLAFLSIAAFLIYRSLKSRSVNRI